MQQQPYSAVNNLLQQQDTRFRSKPRQDQGVGFKSKDQWMHVVESVFEATLCTDEKGIINYCSPKADALFQNLEMQLHGKLFWEVLKMPVESLEEALVLCGGAGMCRIRVNGRELALRIVPMPEMPPQQHAYTLLLMGAENLSEKGASLSFEKADTPLVRAMARAVFQESRHPILLMDRQGFVVAANDSAGELFEREDVSEEGFAGEQLETLLAAARGPELQKQILSMNGEDFTCCCDLQTADGKSMPLEMYASKVEMEEGRFLYKLTFEDMSERRALEEGLQRKVEEVEEMQITLRNVMRSAVQEKDSFKEDLSHMIRVEVLPTLRKMSQEQDEELRHNYQEVIQDQLGGLAGTAQDEPDTLFYDLTPTELQVCEYIRAGHATKEISETMHLAFETVQTHRKNIRHKLGLKGRKVSLYMFLRSRGRMS